VEFKISKIFSPYNKNQKKYRETDLPKSIISPYSQCTNIVIFALFSLLTDYRAVIAVQFLIILISILIFRMKIKNFHMQQILSILPILFFIFAVNSFRGGGEIIFRWGPFILIKQGMMRGLYYGGVIVELFIMSKLLTGSFNEKEIISMLFTLDRVWVRIFSFFKSKVSRYRENNIEERVNFTFVLYYVLLIFNISYSELGVFFKKSNLPVKERIIYFFSRVFRKSTIEYQRIESLEAINILPVFNDYVYSLMQVTALISSVYIKL